MKRLPNSELNMRIIRKFSIYKDGDMKIQNSNIKKNSITSRLESIRISNRLSELLSVNCRYYYF